MENLESSGFLFLSYFEDIVNPHVLHFKRKSFMEFISGYLTFLHCPGP